MQCWTSSRILSKLNSWISTKSHFLKDSNTIGNATKNKEWFNSSLSRVKLLWVSSFPLHNEASLRLMKVNLSMNSSSVKSMFGGITTLSSSNKLVKSIFPSFKFGSEYSDFLSYSVLREFLFPRTLLVEEFAACGFGQMTESSPHWVLKSDSEDSVMYVNPWAFRDSSYISSSKMQTAMLLFFPLASWTTVFTTCSMISMNPILLEALILTLLQSSNWRLYEGLEYVGFIKCWHQRKLWVAIHHSRCRRISAQYRFLRAAVRIKDIRVVLTIRHSSILQWSAWYGQAWWDYPSVWADNSWAPSRCSRASSGTRTCRWCFRS